MGRGAASRTLLTIAKDQKLVTLASGDLSKQREQVVGDTLRVLTHDAGRMGTAGVEVAEESAVPLLERLTGLLEVAALSLDVVGNDIFDNGLGAAVGVGGADGAVFGDRDHVLEAGGIAIDGSGG